MAAVSIADGDLSRVTRGVGRRARRGTVSETRRNRPAPGSGRPRPPGGGRLSLEAGWSERGLGGGAEFASLAKGRAAGAAQPRRLSESR